jgi:hypothetical protein
MCTDLVCWKWFSSSTRHAEGQTQAELGAAEKNGVNRPPVEISSNHRPDDAGSYGATSVSG